MKQFVSASVHVELHMKQKGAVGDAPGMWPQEHPDQFLMADST